MPQSNSLVPTKGELPVRIQFCLGPDREVPVELHEGKERAKRFGPSAAWEVPISVYVTCARNS